jgi:hypothetical protein
MSHADYSIQCQWSLILTMTHFTEVVLAASEPRAVDHTDIWVREGA